MFTLLGKLAEIISTHCSRFFDQRKTSQDVEVAAELGRAVLMLQDICARGERILRSADELLGHGVESKSSANFGALVDQQVDALRELQEFLDEQRSLLATIDPGLYIELAPLIDSKSGLLTRWQQQASQSKFSSTTVFFMPKTELEQVLTVGQAQSGPSGLALDRVDYVAATADALRGVRSDEIRDLRNVTAGSRPTVEAQIATARTELGQARDVCSGLFESIQSALGPEAMAGLRRNLVKQSRA